jgi:hypothetical protein
VYAKRPFGGQVLEYLGRYTHRVAIANSRLLAWENGRVSFRWKDYRSNNKSKAMTLDADEFIRRFLLHVLPKGVPPHSSLRIPAERLSCRQACSRPRGSPSPAALSGRHHEDYRGTGDRAHAWRGRAPAQT